MKKIFSLLLFFLICAFAVSAAYERVVEAQVDSIETASNSDVEDNVEIEDNKIAAVEGVESNKEGEVVPIDVSDKQENMVVAVEGVESNIEGNVAPIDVNDKPDEIVVAIEGVEANKEGEVVPIDVSDKQENMVVAVEGTESDGGGSEYPKEEGFIRRILNFLLPEPPVEAEEQDSKSGVSVITPDVMETKDIVEEQESVESTKDIEPSEEGTEMSFFDKIISWFKNEE